MLGLSTKKAVSRHLNENADQRVTQMKAKANDVVQTAVFMRYSESLILKKNNQKQINEQKHLKKVSFTCQSFSPLL